MHGEIGQDGGIVRRHLQRLTPGGLGVVGARDLLIGHAQQRHIAPILGLQGAQLVQGIDGVEALAGGQMGAGGFQQGLTIGGFDDQHLFRRAGGLVIAAEGPERGREPDAGLGVAGIDGDLVAPEGGAGQGLQPLSLGALLGAGLFRRRGGGGLDRLGRGGFRCRGRGGHGLAGGRRGGVGSRGDGQGGQQKGAQWQEKLAMKRTRTHADALPGEVRLQHPPPASTKR